MSDIRINKASAVPPAKAWVQKAIEMDAAGKKLKQIADALGVKRSTVYNALVKARGKVSRHRPSKNNASSA